MQMVGCYYCRETGSITQEHDFGLVELLTCPACGGAKRIPLLFTARALLVQLKSVCRDAGNLRSEAMRVAEMIEPTLVDPDEPA